ncbi:CHAT domain-containing protein [Maribacter algicola]|uniref:CHAT domain-containing protein n=1 Tax=Maribacter algicola TaxID=2498892 RepID=A0A3R8Q225_9FLAO|nr:CHAT domain-containing protein [Maribacter algicola]RRQ50709.1 CHAT domain-containing protein [Maribacter algicola]
MKAFFFLIFLNFLLVVYLQAQQSPLGKIASLNTQAESYYYSEKDSANFYYFQILEIQKEKKDLDGMLETYFNLAGVASYHADLHQTVFVLGKLDSLLFNSHQKNTISSIENRNYLKYFKGDYLYKLNQNNKSIEIFRNLIDDIENVPISERTPTMNGLMTAAYGFLGKMYMLEGQYARSKEIYERNIRELSENMEGNEESLYDHYNLLAQVLLKEKKYHEANNYLLRNFRYNLENDNQNSLVYGGFYLAESYLNLSQPDSALVFLNKIESTVQKNPVFNSLYQLRKADVLEAENKYDEALSLLEGTLTSFTNLNDQTFTREHEIYLKIGDLNRQIGKKESALENYKLSLKTLKTSGAEAINALAIYKRIAEIYNEQKSADGYQKSIETAWRGANLIDSLRPSFTGSEDKFQLIENAFPLFESGLEAYYQLTVLAPSDSLASNMFHLMEKSKSVVSLESLMATNATRFGQIPEQLIEQEELLKGQILILEKAVQRNTDSSSESTQELFQRKEEYQQLIARVEKEYPKYHQLKYNTQTTSIDVLQKVLDLDQAFISYFYGERAIYGISISKNQAQLAKIELDQTLEKSIEEFRKMVADPKSDIDALKKVATGLYASLLAPVLPKRSKKLIIAPDGPLNYIPFSALIDPEKPDSFLVLSKAVSHINSATLFMQLLKRNVNNGKLLAFAPSFQGQTIEPGITRNSLSPLPHNKDEVMALSQLFDGSIFVQNEASLQNFLDQAESYEILHLATHAVYNNDQPDFSYLAFSPNTDSFLLYVKDLYNLQINANLVTLSACETALGDLKKGEGLIGLTRGFFYSGAKSITSSLWNVNDASTTKMMGDYYQYLARGENKAVALQMAQKDFLNLNRENALAHPYYWSGFILHGNPVKIASGGAWWFLVLPIIILLAVAVFTFGKKKGQTGLA